MSKEERKEYQRIYAKNAYRKLTKEQRLKRNTSERAKKAKAKYLSTERGKQKTAEYSRKWYQQNKERKRETSRLSRYGLSKILYAQLIEKQKGLCAICKEIPKKKDKFASKDGFAIDHDHITGRVRGLLCENCNKGLGNFKDSKDFLQNAIMYLGGVD